jgi:hypothetical protein
LAKIFIIFSFKNKLRVCVKRQKSTVSQNIMKK